MIVQVEEFESIQPEWENILPHCSTNTIFTTPWLQILWWKHFSNGNKLIILSIRNNAGIVGIAPLVSCNEEITFLGGTDLFDCHDFLVRTGMEPEFYTVLWNHLIDLNWNTLNFGSLPANSPTLTYLPDAAKSSRIHLKITEEDKSPVALLPNTWDEYIEGLSKKHRHELRRKLRRLEAQDSYIQYLCDDERAVLENMDDFFRLHRASRPDKRAFLTPKRERFFMDMAMDLVSRGQFKLSLLEIDNVRVAASICMDYNGSLLLYNSGYDPNYSSLSVGLLNKALFIKQAIKDGKKSFDFLRGDERYKYHLGGIERSVYSMKIRRQ